MITIDDKPLRRELQMQWDLNESVNIATIVPLGKPLEESDKRDLVCTHCRISKATHVKISGGLRTHLCYVCAIIYLNDAKRFEMTHSSRMKPDSSNVLGNKNV